MPERTLTGIGELDRLLGGGLPGGTVTLVYGGSGVGKSVFGVQVLKAGLDKGEDCVYHLLDRPYPWLVQYSEALGLKVQEAIEEGRLRVLQSFPHFFPFPKPAGMVYLPSGQLQEIREYFMGKEPKRLILGDLCVSFLASFSARELGDWLAWVNDLAFFSGTSVFILLSGQEGSQDFDRYRTVIEKYAQNIIALRQIEEKREMRLIKIEGMPHPMDWLNIGIGPAGIKLKV